VIWNETVALAFPGSRKAWQMCNGVVKIKGDDYPMYPTVVTDENLHRHIEDVGRRLLGSYKVNPGSAGS
jgi:hypothetical protein